MIITGGGADVILIGHGQSAATATGAEVITDWASTDTLTFAHGPTGASDYVETTAASFTAAATAANALIAAGTADVVAVAVGSDVWWCSPTAATTTASPMTRSCCRGAA